MKKRKYIQVILVLVVSFFSFLMIGCESKTDDSIDNSQVDNKNNKEDKKDESKESEKIEEDKKDDQGEKQEETPEYYFLDDYDNKVYLTTEDQIDGYHNYENNIYFVSKRVKDLNVGDAINICNKNGVVGLNVFDTMANCLIYVNALDDESTPIIYLDAGKINEVFHLYKDNLTIYGPYAGVSDEASRDVTKEAIFTGSVSVRGDNITIDGVSVNDLDNTITIYGKNVVLRNIIKNKELE